MNKAFRSSPLKRSRCVKLNRTVSQQSPPKRIPPPRLHFRPSSTSPRTIKSIGPPESNIPFFQSPQLLLASKMKYILISLALPLLVAAAPVGEPNPPFTVMAIRSASPIHYMQMNAAGQKFWLGGETTSYCPTQVVPNCPPGNQTVFAPGGNALVMPNQVPTLESTVK